MHQQQLSRRRALALAGLALGSAAIPAARAASPTPPSRRVLRFAHPTDIHVQPELRAGDGMAACFRHMMSLAEPPELIICGGDLPMDTASTPEDRARDEWELFKSTLAKTVPPSVPIKYALGNHDNFGRDKVACKASGNEPFFGRNWFLQNFGYERTWQSFNQGGWHFVILDSIDLLPDGDEFVCRIVGEQLDWLRSDLAASANVPTVIVSHAPIMSVANYFDKDDNEWATDGPDLKISAKRMHVDCRELEALFLAHKHVKLCLSGHLHLLDTCVYNDITYICDGAVSGAKWKGRKRQTPEGYGLIDLYEDGSFSHQYMTFGWKSDPGVKPKKS
ncbi:MAG: metallophosphoesterase [Phycisphaerales bacterium]